MILSERHIIKRTSTMFEKIDEVSFKQKNLYNSALYAVRQYYFENKKYLNKYELIKTFTKTNQVDYISLQRKVSQQVIFMVDRNFKQFFSLLKMKQSGKYKNKIKLPKYLNKNGRCVVIYSNQAISKKQLKNNKLKLSGVDFEIPIKHTNINEVRIVPKNGFYVIDVLYEIEEKSLKENNNRYASVDLGVDNLATVQFNDNGCSPYIINGKQLKSINHNYNKKLQEYKSKQDKSKNKEIYRKKMQSISFRRNNKINNYLHKSSRYIVNHLVSNNINTLIIGYNKDWKQETNIGKTNNQNFIQIPHSNFISLLKYKARLEGINVVVVNESYTSKCSFIDNEDICFHEKYVGERIKRGLFKSSSGLLINADLNGSLNIMKKAVPNAFKEGYGIRVFSTPTVVSTKKFL